MKLRPKIKEPTDANPSAVNQTKCLKAAKPQQSPDIHTYTWTIPPDDRDGLGVHVGKRGHIVLTQHPPFMDQQVITLHPAEAQTFYEILPTAITAAQAHGKAAP